MRRSFPALAYHDLLPLYPQILFVISTISTLLTPVRHSLLISTVSWLLILLYTTLKVGIRAKRERGARKRLTWAVGSLLVLSNICDRAAWDKDGMCWSKSLLPLTVFAISNIQPFSLSLPTYHEETPDPLASASSRKQNTLGIACGIMALLIGSTYVTTQTVALGLCSILSTSLGLYVLQTVTTLSKDGKDGDARGVVSANGAIDLINPPAFEGIDYNYFILRDLSVVMALSGAIATFFLESLSMDGLSWNPAIIVIGERWKEYQAGYIIFLCLSMVIVQSIGSALMVWMISQHGALRTSFVFMASALVSRLSLASSIIRVLLASFFAAMNAAYLKDSTGSNETIISTRLLSRPKYVAFALMSITVFALISSDMRHVTRRFPSHPLYLSYETIGLSGPVKLEYSDIHPVQQLLSSGDDEFTKILSKQSKTLEDAVTEYRRRYQLHPPPHFDKWYEFATKNGVQLIDEFDTIYHTLLPFWALKPSTIRSRAREAVGNDQNFLIGLYIRDGKVQAVEKGPEWQQAGTMGMLKEFVQYLPDMDIALNIHDEPRVIVPNSQLSKMVEAARNERIPASFKNPSPRNAFSTKPADLTSPERIPVLSTTRFNKFPHQPTWTHSKLSCPPDTPSGGYEDDIPDNRTSYSLGELGFIYNVTAFTDVCVSPSLRERYGFFDGPNAYNIVQDLFPIFSQSKVSTYQDIIYPSPWYWYEKVKYDEQKDMNWDSKKRALYWRGSTTGGYSRSSSWRRYHRQHVIRQLNHPGEATILTRKPDYVNSNVDPNALTNWHTKTIKRNELSSLVDVQFTHIGQCDENDCKEQKSIFNVTGPADQQDAWQYRHLLDIDGNAFSGRFYAFLQSNSLVYKMALFREWHQEWIRPWVHFIPLSLRGDEWLEVVRWFDAEWEGGTRAKHMAETSREWAGKALRPIDMEAWLFRLLLEYARLVDDDRENIGFLGA